MKPRLADAIRGLTFHPDDVPEFDAFEAHEVLLEVLSEFGWEQIDSHRLGWGDSGSGVEYVLWVGAFGTIEIARNERAMPADLTVQFRGSWREIVPAALAYLASIQAR